MPNSKGSPSSLVWLPSLVWLRGCLRRSVDRPASMLSEPNTRHHARSCEPPQTGHCGLRSGVCGSACRHAMVPQFDVRRVRDDLLQPSCIWGWLTHTIELLRPCGQRSARPARFEECSSAPWICAGRQWKTPSQHHPMRSATSSSTSKLGRCSLCHVVNRSLAAIEHRFLASQNGNSKMARRAGP
jgi:hypothetical protein